MASCPLGWRPDFNGVACEPEGDLPVVYYPVLILSILAAAIAIGGQYSSKNVFQQHRKLLSFYALLGLLDVLAMWAQLIFTFF